MKKLLIVVIALMLLTPAAYAAPLMDYSLGRVVFDLGVNASPQQNNYYSGESNGITTGYNIDYGFTAGAGNNFAISYSQQNMSGTEQSKTYSGGFYYRQTPTMQVQQLNLLYNFAPKAAAYNLSVFIGAQYGTLGSVRYYGNTHSVPVAQKSTEQDSLNLWGGQIGVSAAAHVANSVIVFGQAQYGWPYYQLGGGC